MHSCAHFATRSHNAYRRTERQTNKSHPVRIVNFHLFFLWRFLCICWQSNQTNVSQSLDFEKRYQAQCNKIWVGIFSLSLSLALYLSLCLHWIFQIESHIHITRRAGLKRTLSLHAPFFAGQINTLGRIENHFIGNQCRRLFSVPYARARFAQKIMGKCIELKWHNISTVPCACVAKPTAVCSISNEMKLEHEKRREDTFYALQLIHICR